VAFRGSFCEFRGCFAFDHAEPAVILSEPMNRARAKAGETASPRERSFQSLRSFRMTPRQAKKASRGFSRKNSTDYHGFFSVAVSVNSVVGFCFDHTEPAVILSDPMNRFRAKAGETTSPRERPFQSLCDAQASEAILA